MPDLIDWDNEDLWDRLDENHGVRDLEPILRTFLDFLISQGWQPPAQASRLATVEWQPGRWWRVLASGPGSPDQSVWIETRAEQEARAALTALPEDRRPGHLQRMWITGQRSEWRDA